MEQDTALSSGKLLLTDMLARDIKKAAKAASVREVNFRFWKEHF